MKKGTHLSAAIMGALLAAGIPAQLTGVPERVPEASGISSKSQPATPGSTPSFGKFDSLFAGGGYGRRNPFGRGKPVRHSVAQDRRLARKARNVKRHRARA